jgi:SMC interacting uncharacterized protein involved in chromosome segregation
MSELTQQLESINRRIDRQDDTLDKISEVIIQNAVVMERQVNLTEKMDRINDDIKIIDDKVNANKLQLTKWSGAIAVLAFIAPFIPKLIELF